MTKLSKNLLATAYVPVDGTDPMTGDLQIAKATPLVSLYTNTGTNAGDGVLMGGGPITSQQVSLMYGVFGAAPGDIGYFGDDIFNSASDTARLTIADPSGCIIGSLLLSLSAARVGGTEATQTDSVVNNSTNGANSLYVGTANGPFADLINPSETFTAWASGSGLTSQQRIDYYNHIQDYMVTMGWEA